MAEKDSLIKDFKAFLLRGNVVDLAIAVVIGIAFGLVIHAFVTDLITPIVSIPGKTNFQELHFTIRHSVFAYGDFINTVVNFIVVAAAVFFFVVVPVNHLMNRRRTEPDPEDETRVCPECLSSIPKAATRCAFCTAVSAPV
jgi:large conductance mechanosensitive channel